MFVRTKRSGTREYLQIVESYREGARVRQRVIGTLGRKDQLVQGGKLDKLLESLAQFSTKLQVVERVRTRGLRAHRGRSWGPALVFGRLWAQQGVPEILTGLARGRRFGFDLERASFAVALQRLCAPGSDLGGSRWLQTIECPGMEGLGVHHLYRAVGGFLGAVREQVEVELFERYRDLFSQELDLVFLDTTSTFVWRDEETPLRRRGYSRDRRPDQPQIVLCVAVDRHGWPVAWEILPGNTADKRALEAMIGRLRERFHIRRVIVVADRGMMSAGSVELLAASAQAPFEYILGCRMRKQKEVSATVLARAGRFRTVQENLQVKEVMVRGHRYIVCRNPLEQQRDAQAREQIVGMLEHKLKEQGPKSLVANKGYARFLRVRKGALSIDREAVERDARLDGKFVLRTNTELDPGEVATAYKSLWRVERTFRETKSTLQVRPIYHQRDQSCIGHIVGCFLALRLEVDLQRRLDGRGITVSWPDLMRDLGEVRAVDVTLDGQRYRLRTDLVGHAHAAFAAAGVRPPSAVTHLGPAQGC